MCNKFSELICIVQIFSVTWLCCWWKHAINVALLNKMFYKLLHLTHLFISFHHHHLK